MGDNRLYCRQCVFRRFLDALGQGSFSIPVKPSLCALREAMEREVFILSALERDGEMALSLLYEGSG